MTGRIDPCTPLVTVKTRTMVFFRWEGHTEWLKDDEARFLLENDKRRERPIIAYVVRCRPRVRR